MFVLVDAVDFLSAAPFVDSNDDFVIKIVTVAADDLYLIHCSQMSFAADAALLDTLLDLYVQIREFFLESTINLPFTFGMFAKSYFHVKS